MRDVTDSVENISEEELPDVISEQFEAILDLDKRIQEATENCANAKAMADRMIVAKNLNKKEAINATQDVVRSLADAQASLSDAQKVLFENQQKMANGMRYLLMLGASSIAMNRAVILELEKKLKDAEKGKLSVQAREELIGVINLLREQESAFSKQDRMSEQIKKHDREIETMHSVDAKQNETDKKHDAMIAENASKNAEQDSEIQRQQVVDKKHEEQLRKIKILAWLGIGIATLALIASIIGLIF